VERKLSDLMNLTEKDIRIVQTMDGWFLALSENKDIQFFVKSPDYRTLRLLLRERMNWIESYSDFSINVNYHALFLHYSHLDD
jgi:hypothetical protein